jgi:hypothetical protein
MHLTDDQIEEIVQGRSPEPADLDAASRQRLAEARAIRSRLRRAFASVQAPAGLADRIRQDAAKAVSEGPGEVARRSVLRFPRALWPALAAAAILIIGIPLVMLLFRPEEAMAQPQLAQIHDDNLKAKGPHWHEWSDPAEIAEDIEVEHGFQPILPPAGPDLRYRGCGQRRMDGKDVASYVVELRRGRHRARVSLVVVDRPLEQLHFGNFTEEHCWCVYRKCKMAAVRVGDRTYVAVGPADLLTHNDLQGLLDDIVALSCS